MADPKTARDASSASSPPPAELAFDWEDKERRVNLGAILIGAMAAATGAGMCGLAKAPEVGVVFILAYVGWLVHHLRSRGKRPSLNLRVEDQSLFVPSSEGEVEDGVLKGTWIPLDLLVDVQLDWKDVAHVNIDFQVGAPMIGTTVSPKARAGRIALIVADEHTDEERSMPLSKTYASDTHSTEYLGKVRRFLRLHGWIPDDERAARASK